MNLAQFLVLVTLCVLWLVFATRVEQPLRENAIRFLFTGAMLNMVFFVFNLIPLPPLDGSAILANFSRGYRNLLTTEFGQVGAFIGMALLFMSGGSKVWLFAGSATNAVISIAMGLFTKTP